MRSPSHAGGMSKGGIHEASLVTSWNSLDGNSGPAPAAADPAAAGGGPALRSPQAGAPATKPPARPAAPDAVTINFVNAEIEGVVKAVSEITGKNFVLDPRVKGTVNIVSSRPIARALVYEVFLSALRLQ